MKKSLVMCGVAALALASCTKNEVLDVNDGNAIKFNAFVNNNTRAAEVSKNNLSQFNVFGYHDVNIYDYTNVLVTGSSATGWSSKTEAYWQKGKSYEFAAYSDGNSSIQNENVSFENATLTLKDYVVSDRDLIVAQTSIASQDDVENYTPVEFNFRHMLSQIKFSFKNTDTRDYKMKISNLKITAGIKGTGKHTIFNSEPVITWNVLESGEYTIDGLADIAEGEISDYHETESILILPQMNDDLKVKFTATLTDAANNKIGEGDFIASLDSNTSTSYSSWLPGYRYNYTATINGSDVPVDPTDPDNKLKEIKFTVDEIDGWITVAGSTTDPDNVVRP